jgi:hypothetical protein
MSAKHIPPRHGTRLEPLFLELNGILSRGEQYLRDQLPVPTIS